MFPYWWIMLKVERKLPEKQKCMKSPSSRRFRNLSAVRRHDHLFAPIESLASLDFGENRITNTDLSNPADPALKKVIVDPGYEFELVTTLFKNRPDVSIVTE